MQPQTLERAIEREFDVLNKKIPEKQSQSFSEEDYYEFNKKLELIKNWLSLFLLFGYILKYRKSELFSLYITEATQKEKEIEEPKLKTSDKHIFSFGVETYEIDIKEGIPKKVKRNPQYDYYLKDAIEKDLKRWHGILDSMPPKPKSIQEIREGIISIFENSNRQNYWKSLDEISQITGYSEMDIKRILNEDKPKKVFEPTIFIENINGKYSTRKTYRKNTPFLRRVYDAYTLRFN